MSGEQIRSKRAAAGIAGHVLARAAGVSRTRLCDLETGAAAFPAAEIARIDAKLDELIETKRRILAIAETLGWPAGVEVRPR